MKEIVIPFIYFGVLLYASITDFKTLVVKDRVHVIIIVLAMINQTMVEHVPGAILLALPFLYLAVKTDKLGGGDVKFIFANGVYLGFKRNYMGIMAGLICLILFYYVKKWLKRKGKKISALIPYLSVGYVIVWIRLFYT